MLCCMIHAIHAIKLQIVQLDSIVLKTNLAAYWNLIHVLSRLRCNNNNKKKHTNEMEKKQQQNAFESHATMLMQTINWRLEEKKNTRINEKNI